MKMTILLARATFAASALAAAFLAEATLVISNMPGNDGTQSAGLSDSRRKAMAFTTDNEDWFLDSATLRLRSTSSFAPVLNLHADSAGTVGALLTTFTNPGSFGTGIVNYTFTSGFQVDANTKYWLVMYAPAGTPAFDWMASSPAQAPTGIWEHTGSLFTTNGGGTWTTSGILTTYEINATIVPEPATMGVLAIGIAALAARRRRK